MIATDATSLRRGLALLRAIECEEGLGAGPPGVTRLAALIGSDKSQVSRSLKILAEHGLVDRDAETLGYRLGWRLLAMAGRSSHSGLLAAAEPLLKRLVRETGERAHLSVLSGTEVLTVLSEGSDHAVQAAGWVGRSVPLHSTSAGRALLFDHTQGEVAQVGRQVRIGGLLVGDEPYYGPLGFARTTPGAIQFPGPVDPNRVLLHSPDDPTLATRLSGPIAAFKRRGT